ncbi:MAG: hypothetical protein ABI036_05560 [Fibrobacteria bacterium]
MKTGTWLKMLLLIWFLALAALGAEEAGLPSSFEPEGKPVLIVRKNQRMLVVVQAGDPGLVGDKAMKALYGVFFKYATEDEKNAPMEPRVRWTLSHARSQERTWIGKYALPISDAFPLPEGKTARLEVWQYGLVAETLHQGPYETEAGSMAELSAFLAGNGFAVTDGLEEQYLVGRGNFPLEKPECYRTLLRYRVGSIPGLAQGPCRPGNPSGGNLPF